MAEWLELPTSDHKVLGSNPGKRNSAHDSTVLHCTEAIIIILPTFRYALNNVERDVKYQIIIHYENKPIQVY